jgi:hypothetical protein
MQRRTRISNDFDLDGDEDEPRQELEGGQDQTQVNSVALTPPADAGPPPTLTCPPRNVAGSPPRVLVADPIPRAPATTAMASPQARVVFTPTATRPNFLDSLIPRSPVQDTVAATPGLF